MIFSRGEYLELMTFGPTRRQMFVELFGPLIGLEDEWRSQWASEDEISLHAFDWDYVLTTPCGGTTDIIGGQTPCVLEENEDFRLTKDELGRTMKLSKKSSTIPLPLNYPVYDMDSWLKVKPLFEFNERRIKWEEVEKAKKDQAAGKLVFGNIPGGFDTPRNLMGEENACLCYYENPELMHDILNTLKDTALKVYERITDRLVIDQLSVHEDLAGKSGPLIGPQQVEGFIKPYFKPVWDLLSSRGTVIFDMDSDGNVNPILDKLIECGINSMHPFEPAAGMDIVEVRKKYGTKLRMRGGIDKHILRKSKEAIRKELEYKMQPMMRDGGIAFGLDHRITNGTPIENYRYYVKLGREILGLPPLNSNERGWARMSF